MRWQWRFLLLLPLLLVLAACGSFPQNPKLDKYDAKAGYRFDNLKTGEKNTDSLFVVLAFSGGGTRAASLSYGVMQALRNTSIKWKGKTKRLLDEVDMISSVSGGSFTSAYYALYRDGIFDGTYESVFLKKDIEKALLSAALSPVNWFKLAGGSYGRSDLAAEYYDENVFAQATFQKLIEKGTRPFLMLNATDMTTGWQFPFIQDQFDLICSDLSRISIARAVASSSAFPGLLTPLTYENHAGKCNYTEPQWVGFAMKDRLTAPERANLAEDRRSYYQQQPWEAKRKFIHLVDGGVADNIGLRSILAALKTTDPAYSLLRRINREQIEKLVVIVVNAATDPQPSRDGSADVPSVLDVLSTAATVPLDNFSFDTVNQLRSVVKEYNTSVALRKKCNKILKKHCPAAKLPDGELYELDLYLVQVAFDFIKDPQTRFKYKNLPTTFNLPAATVDDLIEMGGKLLHQDKDFRRLTGNLGATGG